MWKYYSVSTANWADKIEIPAMEFTGGRALNIGCDGSTTFDVEDKEVNELVTATSIAPLERVLVATWLENAVYAGFITDIDEDQGNGTLSVRHSDIWWLLQRRYLLASRDNNAAAAAPIAWTGQPLAALANYVVNRGMQGDPADRYNLPIAFSYEPGGATADRTYFGYEFMSVSDALDDIIKSNGGPYVEFDSRWASGTTSLEWSMRSGELTSGEWEWDATAPKSAVSGLKLTTSAQKVSNKVYGTGEGSERLKPVRTASSFTTAPALERVDNYGSKTIAELSSRTLAGLNASNEPTKQISFSIPTDGAVSVADLQLGGTAHLKTAGLRQLSDGWHDWRLIQFDFNRELINLQFQQIGG
ncbi:hypothetical protein ARZXY2_2516 [Arthrobacter sp. ZXY-2]|nr:hypothetical protein ARZXY2_2516 [Arthrobacter sp. ZXY-2]